MEGGPVAGHRRLLTQRFAGDGVPLAYRAFVPPASPGPRLAPPLVVVHGASRGAGQHFRAFLPLAIALGLPLVVPTFESSRFARYQTLGGDDGPLAALEALDRTLLDVTAELDVDTSTVDLLGYSGGAQFAHRYALFAPQRVRRLVVAAAGWYTFLDERSPFPRGCGPSLVSGQRSPDVDGFLDLPMHVLVGARDVARGGSLRVGSRLDDRQGPTRLTRALRWVDHLEEAAGRRGRECRVSFDVLPDAGHAFSEAVRHGSLVERAAYFLHPGDHGSLADAYFGTDRSWP